MRCVWLLFLNRACDFLLFLSLDWLVSGKLMQKSGNYAAQHWCNEENPEVIEQSFLSING